MDIQDYFKSKGYQVESVTKNSSNQISPRLEVPKNTLVFFDTLGTHLLNKDIESNYKKLRSEFNTSNWNFVFLPSIDFPELDEDFIHFLIPQLYSRLKLIDYRMFDLLRSQIEEDIKYFSSFNEDNISLLNFLGYKGGITSGVALILENTVLIVKYDNEDIEKGLPSILNELMNYEGSREIDFSLHSREDFTQEQRDKFENSIDASLDEETRAKIESILSQIKDLKRSGKLLYILPLLEKSLTELKTEINYDSSSPIYVDDESKILIPEFNNLEIPLSPLTKTVYILFTKHPEGIYIDELGKYQNELMEIYISISSQKNLDKMRKSINELVNPDNNAIYTHISRIKSVVYKIMDKPFAQKYMISSDIFGSSKKYIQAIYTDFDKDLSKVPI